jgi:hypothetical protein
VVHQSITGNAETHALAVLFLSSAGTLRRRWFGGNLLVIVLGLPASGSTDDMVFKDYSFGRIHCPRSLMVEELESYGGPLSVQV